jgi:CDP-4-dehydro-6-deoxyglucose reductase
MGRAFQVTLKRTGRSFAVEPGERILDAALRQEVWLPHACRGGTCGSCSAKVVEGVVNHGDAERPRLRDSEARLCVALALSDLTLDVEEQPGPQIQTARRMPARVIEIIRTSSDVVVLTLKFPPTETLNFGPGQYVALLAPDGRTRPFSIANAPRRDGTIELHIGRIPGGAFTGYVHDELQPGTILRLEGPFGSFGLREESERPAVLIAGGTGIAPIKAILEAAARSASPRRRMYVYWGSRRPEGLYALDAVAAAAASAGAICFRPVVSEAGGDDAWMGRTGLVHHAVLEDLPNLSEFEAYVCGGPALVEAARRDLTGRAGLAPDCFFADAFHRLSPVPEQASTA